MSATLKYVKDFDFGPQKVMVRAYSRGGPVKKFKSDSILEKATGERYSSREAMIKHEAKETPRIRREEIIQRSKVTKPQPNNQKAPLVAMKRGGTLICCKK